MGYESEPGVEIYGPGESLPTALDRGPVGRPAQGHDFDWMQPGPIGRWRGRRLAKAVNGQAAGVAIATEYYTQAAAFESARQELVLAHQEAALLPLKLQTHRQQLQEELLHGQMHLDAVLQERHQAADLAEAEHQIELLNRKAEKLEVNRLGFPGGRFV
jgi:hypothetical protein